MMTRSQLSAAILGLTLLLGACGRPEEKAATTSGNTSVPAAQTAAATTVPSSATAVSTACDPDPFEMTAPPLPPDPNGPCVLGTKTGADGKVTDAVVSFARNDPIVLTVRPKTAASKLRIEIVAPMGERLQTFSGPLQPHYALSALPRGRYRVNAFVGQDTVVCNQLAFEVR